MKTIPLFRTRLSNERLMTALVVILLLYNVPRFLHNPVSIRDALILLAAGLVLDAVCQFILNKRLRCAVSAAVTVLILFTLSPAVPLWALTAAVFLALVAGKAVWGGTGKNPLNPAMLGLVLLGFFYPVGFTATNLAFLLPAAVLSLPFLLMRPYAAVGYAAGTAASLLFQPALSPAGIAASGIAIWTCLVITDPVTTTSKPAAGAVIGFLAGLVPNLFGGGSFALALGILASNILSYLADRFHIGKDIHDRWTFSKGQKIQFTPGVTPFIDLTGLHDDGGVSPDISGGEILSRIEACQVFGCGGAAFPTGRKIRAVLESGASEKHLIINAAECDPGLIHDKWLLVNRTAMIQQGITYLTKCIRFDTVTVAAKHFYHVRFDAPITSYRVTDFYPAGAETLLIQEILKKSPGGGTTPAAAGILVLNLQTVFNVAEAVGRRKTGTRFLTAADLDSRIGTVVRAELGADVHKTLRRVYPDAVNVFTGGGAMGASLAGDGDTVTERTNFIARGQVKGFREAACSSCDFCSMYCPSELRVRDIAQLVDAKKMDQAALLEPDKCISCALCSTVCLAGRDQAARVKAAASFRAEKSAFNVKYEK